MAMAPTGIQIVDAAPERRRRPLLRWLSAFLGMLLLIIGALLLTPILIVVTLISVFAVSSGEADPPDLQATLIVLALTAGGVVLWLLGVKLLRGKPRTVLFLRKFGFEDAKNFVSFAASDALGRRWRLVTLDDLATQPIATKQWKRWALRIGIFALAVAAIWLITQAMQTALNPNTSAVDNAVESAVENADNPVEAIFATIAVTIVVAIVVAIGTVLGVMFVAAIASVVAVLGLASAITSRSLTRAERDKWTPARSREELIAFLDRTKHAQSKLFAPRIAVVRSIDALWKEAVAGLADISDVVLIDISDPSESLLWEVQMLSRRPDVRLILIGAADKIEALKATGGHDADDRAVLDVLGNRHVLVYRHDRKAFAGELQHMFDTAL
ncbi:MAG: hypothetical protein ACRBK7_15680 [Acidimicrobiales bacterium]